MATDRDPGVTADSGAVGEADAVTIHVRSSNGSKLLVQTALESTVGAFKVLLAEKSDVPAERQRLIYKGRILKNEKTLKSYGAPISSLISVLWLLFSPMVWPSTCRSLFWSFEMDVVNRMLYWLKYEKG